MSNKSYLKGVRLERKLVNEARDKNLLAYRSSGSHSLIDVTIIDPKKFKIRLIQCKNMKYVSPKEKQKYEDFLKMSGEYMVETEIISNERKNTK